MTLFPGWDSPEFVRDAHLILEFSSILGFFACAGFELAAHLNPAHEKRFERIAIGFFFLAVIVELTAFPYGLRNDELADERARRQGFAISLLSDEAKEVHKQLKKALDDSTSAISNARDAKTEADLAKQSSDKAELASSDAMDLARGARREADSFENDIRSAKQQAAEAESHLGEAVSMAKAEETELLELEAEVAPRILSIERQRLITDALRRFYGRSVLVETYGMDGEGAAVGTQIIAVLRLAGIQATDHRAYSIVTGGFDFGVHVRGPETEQSFVLAIADALNTIGKLQVWTNKGIFRPGVRQSGGTATSGTAIGGGGGPPGPDGPTPPGTPVTIFVGIKPVEILLAQ